MNKQLKFIDLFAGLGGFHQALAELGHELVFASELDPELRGIYRDNFQNEVSGIAILARPRCDALTTYGAPATLHPATRMPRSGAPFDIENNGSTRGILNMGPQFVARRSDLMISEEVGNPVVARSNPIPASHR